MTPWIFVHRSICHNPHSSDPAAARKLSTTCMTYTTAECTVNNCWWWTEELSEICRVSVQNKFEKLVHLVGFIIRKSVTMHGRMNVKWDSSITTQIGHKHTPVSLHSSVTNTLQYHHTARLQTHSSITTQLGYKHTPVSLHSSVTNTPSVKKLCPQNTCFSLYVRKNIKC
jgi:hypothetical protein